jgi:hypothetical protein
VGHGVAAGGARGEALQVVQAGDAGLAERVADLASGALVVVLTRDAHVAARGVADLTGASTGDVVDALHALVRGHVALRRASAALVVAEAFDTNFARGVADGFVAAATLGHVGAGDAALVGL